nr:hypothetical protein CFP56_56244 [Quercus suber]
MWNLLLNEDVGDDQVAQAVTIAWALWHNRNELRYGGEGKSGQHLTRWVADYLIEFRVAVAQNTPGVPVPRQKAVGVGVVIRNDKGRLEVALCKKIAAPMGATEVEAKAKNACSSQLNF